MVLEELARQPLDYGMLRSYGVLKTSVGSNLWVISIFDSPWRASGSSRPGSGLGLLGSIALLIVELRLR